MAVDLRRVLVVVAGLALPVLAGCTATSGETATDYPDITALVGSATTQMSDEEAAAMSANLDQLAARRASGAISEGEYRRRVAEMQALAGGHGAQALSEIEK
jgi:hypothetical protein